MEQEVTIVSATVPGVVGKRPKTYPRGRVCSNDECDTILTRYNKDSFCYLHQPVRRPRLRGKMPSEVMEKEAVQMELRCRSCGQRARYRADKDQLADVYIDGVTHLEGIRGAATLCEGRL